MAKLPFEVLIARRIYLLFRDRSRWTAGEYARNIDGYYVPLTSKTAHSFCLLGAIKHFADIETDSSTDSSIVYRKIRLYLSGNLLHLNDQVGYSAVMAYLKSKAYPPEDGEI